MAAPELLQFPCALQHDVPAFLRALADDIESGALQQVDRGTITLGYANNGGFSVWGMGPKGVTDYAVLGLITLSSQMMSDHILDQAIENGSP